MKTPIVIIAIMLCFNVLSQAQTTPNRGQELKEQAQNSLSQKDYIKARYLFKKAYEAFAAREDYPQAIECGIKANGLYIRENFYKEGFELCRSMDQLVWAGEQKTKKTLYDLRFLITKERLQMYIALKNPAQAKLQLDKLEETAKLAKNDSINEDLLYTKTNYYYTFGLNTQGDACFRKLILQYKEKKNYELLGKERVNTEAPQMPPNKMFLISGNNSGTGILQNIMDANGTGLICETEADTIASAISSEYGHWSDTLRKAFDHDRLSYNRRTDQEYREVKRIFLAVLLSGTPAQVRALIPSAENGLFSRQLFYYMHGIYTWADQFACGEIDLDEIFRSIGRDWQLKLDILKEHGIHTLRLTDEQKKEFNALFSDLFFRSDIANGNEMRSFIARLAVNICRIMSTIAMLRVLEIPQPYQLKSSDRYAPVPDKEIPTDNVKDGIITRWDITITPEDFKAVLGLVKPLYRHATHILSFLPSSEIPHRANADRDAFFDALGDEFTRTQLTEQATAMGIKPNTALSWLRRLVKKGLFVMKEKGTYVRARVCVC